MASTEQQKFHFDYSEDDWLEFQRYHRKHSTNFNRINSIIVAMVLFLPVLFIVYKLMKGQTLGWKEPVVAGSMLLMGFFVPWYRGIMADTNARMRLKKGQQDVIGTHSITVSETEFIDKAPKKTYRFKWDEFKRIVMSEDYMVLYVTKTGAIVIPLEKAAQHPQWEAAEEVMIRHLADVPKKMV